MTNKEAKELILLVKEQNAVICKMLEIIMTLMDIASRPPIVIQGKK